jgi:hypothetical protein
METPVCMGCLKLTLCSSIARNLVPSSATKSGFGFRSHKMGNPYRSRS